VAFGVLLYALGLSYEGVAAAIRALVRRGSKSTVYRDVIAAGDKAQQLHMHREGKAIRVMGVDGTGQKIKGGCVGVALSVDAEEQQLLGVELVEEEDEAQVRSFLERLCRQYHVEAILTDEHSSYAEATKSRKVRAEHRLCEAHWKKSKQIRIALLRTQAQQRGYRQWVEDLEALSGLVGDRPAGGPKQIQLIHRRYLKYRSAGPGGRWSLGYHMRMLTLHLMETWDRLGSGGQRTNNTTERLIGLLLKIRSRTMRGFARRESIPRFVHLMGYLWENRRNCQLAAIC
jgi:transposase-like protein